MSGFADSLLQALPSPVFVVDGEDVPLLVNPAAEQFFAASAAQLKENKLSQFLSPDSALANLVQLARSRGQTLSEHDMTVETPKIGRRQLSAAVVPLNDPEGAVLVQFHGDGISRQVEQQLSHRRTARSVTALASVLAHEIKNPLAGIRGAAQLLELQAGSNEKPLTKLICDETDRIVGLVEQVDLFADSAMFQRQAVNIHEVLEHVRALVSSSDGYKPEIRDDYDPSLPLVLGNRDRLIQVFLNLMKNAVEALAEAEIAGGQITLRTRFQPGMRLTLANRDSQEELPLLVSVEDNGPGIAPEHQNQLFEPFVSSKAKGRGLGLAMVAKIVDDHGAVIRCHSEPRRTVFSLLLPMAREAEGIPDA